MLLPALVRNGVTVPLDRPVLVTVNVVGVVLVPVLSTTTMTDPSVLRYADTLSGLPPLAAIRVAPGRMNRLKLASAKNRLVGVRVEPLRPIRELSWLVELTPQKYRNAARLALVMPV